MIVRSLAISHSERIPTPTHACMTAGSEMRRTNARATRKYSPYAVSSRSRYVSSAAASCARSAVATDAAASRPVSYP